MEEMRVAHWMCAIGGIIEHQHTPATFDRRLGVLSSAVLCFTHRRDGSHRCPVDNLCSGDDGPRCLQPLRLLRTLGQHRRNVNGDLDWRAHRLLQALNEPRQPFRCKAVDNGPFLSKEPVVRGM
jgi:hypothetical protein